MVKRENIVPGVVLADRYGSKRRVVEFDNERQRLRVLWAAVDRQHGAPRDGTCLLSTLAEWADRIVTDEPDPLASALATVAAMRKVLESLQWGDDPATFPQCPVCFNEPSVGHAPGCALAAAIRKGGGA